MTNALGITAPTSSLTVTVRGESCGGAGGALCWVPATTEDGLWKWDGSRWKGTVDLEGKRPEDLATTLALLAEDRYSEAG